MLADAELDRLAHVEHHEGLVVEARARVWIAPAELGEELVKTRGTGIALDRVRNPYNAGAIVRSAAFFGVGALIVGAPVDHPGLDAQAIRVAEGGAEHLVLARTVHLADALGAFRKRGITVLGADSQAKTDIGDLSLQRPLILVFGNEREGLHERIRAECDHLVGIRGAGRVDSLNVSVAAGILISRIA